MFAHRPCCPCVESKGLLQPSAPRSPLVVLAKFPTLLKELMTPCTTAAASTPKTPSLPFQQRVVPLLSCTIVESCIKAYGMCGTS
jgi:hypothetical protein